MNTDRFSARLIVGTVCLIAGLLAVAVVFGERPLDQTLDRLAFLVFGGLLGALRTSHGSENQDVTVTNPPSDPVPVEPGDAGEMGILTVLLIVLVVILLIRLF